MRTPSLPLLAGLLAVVLLSGCGLGEQDRPIALAAFPTGGGLTQAPIQEIRVDYDDPIGILNPFDSRVFADGILLASVGSTDPDFPRSLFLSPPIGTEWPVGAAFTVTLVQGAVVNSQGHYAAVAYVFDFVAGPEPSVPVTQPGLVTLLDPNTFLAESSTPSPAGQDPVAAMRTAYAGMPRVWAQLDNGGGSGEALAWFTPGDANMTAVALQTSGGDLTSEAPALLLGRDGVFVYAAYRDETSSQVRLVKVDVDTALEVDSLLLESAGSDAAVQPRGMGIDTLRNRLLITADDGDTGTLIYVDLSTFTELDRDDDTPGTQGATLDAGAGPVARSGRWAGVAAPGTSDLTRVNMNDDDVTTQASEIVGTSVDVLRSIDGSILLQPLTGYADGLGLVRRTNIAALTDPVGLEVSDDVGGTSTNATGAVAMQQRAGGPRFFLLLETPTGLILTSWLRVGILVTQEDLDEATEGIQAVDVQAEIPGATSIGATYGTTAD